VRIQSDANPFRQPKAVFAAALACVVSFMGIGLVDPILPGALDEAACDRARLRPPRARPRGRGEALPEPFDSEAELLLPEEQVA
jgi:hypothetical protein